MQVLEHLNRQTQTLSQRLRCLLSAQQGARCDARDGEVSEPTAEQLSLIAATCAQWGINFPEGLLLRVSDEEEQRRPTHRHLPNTREG